MAYLYAGEDSQGMQKYTKEKCPSFFCFSTLHAGTAGSHQFLGFLNMFVVNARNRLAMLSDSESELCITQSSFKPHLHALTKVARQAK